MNRRSLLILFAGLALAGTTGCKKSANSAESAELKSLTVDEVDQRIAAKDGKTFIFDNNPEDRFASGHVPTATWLDYEKVTAKDLPADKGAMLVFYCASEL